MKRRGLALFIVALFCGVALYPRVPGMGRTVALKAMHLPTSFLHPFGTDGLGRDRLARVQEALWETVLPLWGLALLALLCGVFAAGVVANRPRVRAGLESVLLPATAVPLFIVVFFLAALFEKTGFWSVLPPLMILCAARSFQALNALHRESERLGYWQAHAVLGGSARERFFSYGVWGDWRAEGERLIFFHLQVVLAAEVALSYLGFGVAEPQASLGNLLAASYADILKGNIAFALILVGVFALTLLVPPSLAHLTLRETSRARRTSQAARPFLGKASTPTAAARPDPEEDPAWENA